MEKNIERKTTNILITGANGFVGRTLCEFLADKQYRICTVVRRLHDESIVRPEVRNYVVKDITGDTDWSEILADIDIVIHLAARVHVMDDKADDPKAEFYKVNVEGTVNLARQAQKEGVKRFLFLSTVKVNGEETNVTPFTEKDPPAPKDFYGMSKYEAESRLWSIAAESGLEVVVIRCPLIYGPNVKGNFLRLLQLAESRVPLPLASIRNKRSIVSIDNLIDFLVRCIEHEAASGQTFLISDGEDLSTPELITRITREMGHSSRLFAFPPTLLKRICAIFGCRSLMDRLSGSLQVDIQKAEKILNWHPAYTIDEGVAKTVKWFLQREKR